MPSTARLRLIAGAALLLSGLTACQSTPEELASADEPWRHELCEGVQSLVRAPLDENGTRRVWFLPFGSNEDGSVDIYAPMGSWPGDEHSRAFYRGGAGRLTHYQLMPRFASTVSSCLREEDGFSEIRRDAPDNAFRASYRDTLTDRRIDVSAIPHHSAFLVSAADWQGDIEAELDRMLVNDVRLED